MQFINDEEVTTSTFYKLFETDKCRWNEMTETLKEYDWLNIILRFNSSNRIFWENDYAPSKFDRAKRRLHLT